MTLCPIVLDVLEHEHKRTKLIEQRAQRLLEALDERFPKPIRRDTVAREMTALREALDGLEERTP